MDSVTADDGELYNFPAVNTWEEGVFRSGRAILLRGDLLTNMKAEDIKTVEDLERAFLNILENHGKPILSMRDMAAGSTAFDLLPRIMGTSVQDAPWWNPATEQFENQYLTKADATREAVELMARWYELGIIHPEFASQPDRVWEGMLEYRYYTKDELRPLLDYIAAVEATGIDTYFPPTPKYGDQSGLAADIKTNVQTYLLENYIKFINGTKSLDDWDRFVAGLESFRYGQLVDLANAAVQ